MVYLRNYILFTALCLFSVFQASAQEPGDVEAARQELSRKRQAVLKSRSLTNIEKAQRLIDLGDWEEAASLIEREKNTLTAKLVQARLLFLQNEFHQAERLTEEVLQKIPAQRTALMLKARLKVQAWELPEALAIMLELRKRDARDEDAAVLTGRILMLQKKYTEALRWAKRVQEWNPNNPDAYLLESEVHFWKQEPELAEEPLQKSLRLNPFNADARFNYGYAIWRRVDATQLDAMAAQWELALELNPLHYVTHWHWGNGHTNLTYADYAQANDEAVREALKKADTLIAQNRIPEALAYAREVQQQYPASVLPAMLQGSAYYMAFDMDRELRLDSAQAIFQRILRKKEHYGPAHNALAAVIKQKQLSYLGAYDSLRQQIAQTEISDPENFARVFPDVSYYPGDEVQKMVWSQLYESIVYFPFLSKQGEKFLIPPLHIDLAIAMGSPYFRQATTFDNRQWMDIRGVGSGAAAIEYVIRGAYLERNVVLHEYVHQFHGRVFTDAEKREVRRLYHQAMAEGRTLDYYSANNEHEYLAQTYPAYFEPVKVHPLNHKSVNTTQELKAKDPELYAFLDSLVQRQRAYLQGNEQSMASNWAQVYLNLSEQAERKKNFEAALALLDTALQWDAAYQPALLGYASILKEQENFNAAQNWIEKAKAIDSSYAPVYVAEAGLQEALRRAGKITDEEAVLKQEVLFRKALEVEGDLLMRAYTNQQFRELYAAYGKVPEAIMVAEEYLQDAPTISTYLRDRRDDALAFVSYLKGTAATDAGAEEALAALVARKPQHYELRRQYADVLSARGNYKEALNTLTEARRILEAAGSARGDFRLRMAAYQLALGNEAEARTMLQPLLKEPAELQEDLYRLIIIQSELGDTESATDLLKNLPSPSTPIEAANQWYAKARLFEQKGKIRKARKAYAAALQLAPYHREARLSFVRLLEQEGKQEQADSIRNESPALLP